MNILTGMIIGFVAASIIWIRQLVIQSAETKYWYKEFLRVDSDRCECKGKEYDDIIGSNDCCDDHDSCECR